MKKHDAFTLVELSIVLVILGLLVGGVLAGQSLIKAAELRSFATQHSGFKTALNGFRDKYFALPGDMTNATTIWGTAAGGAACVTTAGTGTETCNGDGDGIVKVSTNSNEPFRFWQQLANAGLIEGTYDGIAHGSTTSSTTAANAPAGKLGNGYWVTWSWGTMNGTVWFFNGVYNNVFEYGGLLANNLSVAPLFKPAELWNIDSKIDDGMPGRGKLLAAVTGSAPATSLATCTTAASSADLDATYLLSSEQVTCTPSFPLAY